MSKMITVRISDERQRRLDGLVAEGVFPSRSAALTEALDRLLADEARRAIDRSIVEGYERVPPTEAEDDSSAISTLESIREERW